MNSIYKTFLGDLIELKNLKIVPGKKKKVITSSIFIPENPYIKDKTYSYFVGLIKSIETFSESMPGWIYRLYIDELFVSGISPQRLKMVLSPYTMMYLLPIMKSLQITGEVVKKH